MKKKCFALLVPVFFAYSLFALSKIWGSGGLAYKMKFQKMAFPEGVEYDLENHTYRTKRVNALILQIAQLARVSADKKKRNPSENEKDSFQVAATGIEPVSKV